MSSTDNTTTGAHFMLPPIDLPGGLQCDAYGLIWRDQRRATFAHLWMVLIEEEDMGGEHARCDRLHHLSHCSCASQFHPCRTIEWWKAQCVFMNIPIHSLITISELQGQLKNLLLAGGGFPDALMNCEAEALRTFRDAAASIEKIISATRVGYARPVPQQVPSDLGECVPLKRNPGDKYGVTQHLM